MKFFFIRKFLNQAIKKYLQAVSEFIQEKNLANDDSEDRIKHTKKPFLALYTKKLEFSYYIKEIDQNSLKTKKVKHKKPKIKHSKK